METLLLGRLSVGGPALVQFSFSDDNLTFIIIITPLLQPNLHLMHNRHVKCALYLPINVVWKGRGRSLVLIT